MTLESATIIHRSFDFSHQFLSLCRFQPLAGTMLRQIASSLVQVVETVQPVCILLDNRRTYSAVGIGQLGWLLLVPNSRLSE
ncbi:hypothetical protein D3C78_1386540 [compost metagenome]